jgi:hypothetical protein
MDTKKERARVERLEKLVDMYEQAERRERIMTETEDFLNNLFGTMRFDKSNYRHSMQITNAAKKRIEAAYINTLNTLNHE